MGEGSIDPAAGAPSDPRYRIRPARLPADREAMLRVLETANMHRVPSPEMDDFDVGRWHVAVTNEAVVGVAGFRLLDAPEGPWARPPCSSFTRRRRGLGIGRALQELRMKLMRDAGAVRVITNADRPDSIAWYERHFGYRRIGEVPKVSEFGLREVDRWTTLEAPLR